MTVLARLTKLGGAKEDTAGTYKAPTFSVPFNLGTKFHDLIDPLRDESVRANDSILQGISQGPAHAEWEIDINAYPDILGHFLRAMIGPDTVSAGTSTTLSSDCAANVTTVFLTAAIASNSIIQISDTGGTKTEWVKIGTVTGVGPYTAPISVGGGNNGNSTKYAHTAAGGSVLAQSTHTFNQTRTFSTVWPTYSWTTDDGVDQLGWPGCVCAELGIKIDPKGFVGIIPKFTGQPSAAQSTFVPAYGTLPPLVGWAWTVTNAGATSTRGLTMDITLKRAVEAIMSADGLEGPREVFPGAMEIDGAYKAIFETDGDINLFKSAIQLPTVHTVTQPVPVGGCSLAITMTKSGYTTSERDLGNNYTQLTQALSGIANPTDGGVTSVVLSNYSASGY